MLINLHGMMCDVCETHVSMMAGERVLTEICNLKELKKNTTITKSILLTAQSLLLLKDENKSAHLTYLKMNLSPSYTQCRTECNSTN